MSALTLILGAIAVVMTLCAIYFTVQVSTLKKAEKDKLEAVKTTSQKIISDISSIYIDQTRFLVDLDQFNKGKMTDVAEIQKLQNEINGEASQSTDSVGKVLSGVLASGIGLFLLCLPEKKEVQKKATEEKK